MTQLPDTTTEQGQREASAMLARLRGWRVDYGLIDSDQSWDGFAHDTLTITTDTGKWCDNLYDPAYMALAALILRFARDRYDDFNLTPKAESVLAWFFAYAEDGARTALDSVLTLAIEAGMIEETQ